MSAEAVSLSQPRLMARGALPSRPAATRTPPHRAAGGTGAGAELGRAARSRAMRLNLLAGVVVLAAMLLHVWTGLTVGTLGYQLARSRDLGQRLDRQLNELAIENTGTLKPDLLAEEARRRLGLDWPQSGQIVDLP